MTRTTLLRRALLSTTLCCAVTLGAGTAQAQSSIPAYMEVIVGATIPAAAEVGGSSCTGPASRRWKRLRFRRSTSSSSRSATA